MKTIQHQFDSFCKKVICGEAKDYHRELARRLKQQNCFLEMSEKELNLLCAMENYPSDFYNCYGIEQTAGILQKSEVLKPTEYWKTKGIRKGNRAPAKESPYYRCKSTVTHILTSREYIGDLINFKTYTKSFKNKKRIDNPEENQLVF